MRGVNGTPGRAVAAARRHGGATMTIEITQTLMIEALDRLVRGLTYSHGGERRAYCRVGRCGDRYSLTAHGASADAARRNLEWAIDRLGGMAEAAEGVEIEAYDHGADELFAEPPDPEMEYNASTVFSVALKG